jgi:hypothetical protein
LTTASDGEDICVFNKWKAVAAETMQGSSLQESEKARATKGREERSKEPSERETERQTLIKLNQFSTAVRI